MLFYVIIIVLYCIYLASACLLNETIRINSLVHLFTCSLVHLGYAVYMPSNSTPVSFDITNIVYIMHTYKHEPMCRCRLH